MCFSGCYCSPCKKAGPGLLLKHLQTLGLSILEVGDSHIAHCGGLLLTWGRLCHPGTMGQCLGTLGVVITSGGHLMGTG